MLAALLLAGLNAVFAQSTNYRDYLTSSEETSITRARSNNDARTIENIEKDAQKRMEAARDPRYKDLLLAEFVVDRILAVKVGDITRLARREDKDWALGELLKQIDNNWMYLRLRNAKENFNSTWTPVSPEDIRTEELVKQAEAAFPGFAPAADHLRYRSRITTSPPISEKFVSSVGITPQAFASAWDTSDYGTYIRVAMNIENIVKIADGVMSTGSIMDKVMKYAYDFANTPFTADSAVIRKLADLGVTTDYQSNVVLTEALWGLMIGDFPNHRFISTDQALAKLDEIGFHLQFQRLLFVENGRISFSINTSSISNLETDFGDAIRKAGYDRPRTFIQRLIQRAGDRYYYVAAILVCCRSNPVLLRAYETWDYPAIRNLLDSTPSGRWNWEALGRLLGDR